MLKRRIGVIGLGDIAQKVYLPLLSVHRQVEVIGVGSRTMSTARTIAGQYRIEGAYDTVDALLAESPEAVFVHSPTETHYDIVMACLKQGVHVYVDKPLSYDYAQSEAMARFAQERGLLLAVGFNRRFAPLYNQAKSWAEQAGGFELCSAVKHRTKLQQHSAKHTLYDDLIHMLDMLLWLGGDQYTDLQYIQRANDEGRLMMAAGSLVFAGPGTPAGQFGMARTAGADMEKLELHGFGRSVEVTNMESAVFMERGALPQQGAFGSWDTIVRRRGFAGAVEHFLDSLSDHSRCEIRADRVLPVHELVERLQA